MIPHILRKKNNKNNRVLAEYHNSLIASNIFILNLSIYIYIIASFYFAIFFFVLYFRLVPAND